MDFQGHFCNNAQRPFTAQIQHGQIRSGSVTGHRQSPDDLSGGSDHFQRHDHIFDLAVFGGKHPGPPVCQKSPDSGTGNGCRQMHGGKTFLVAVPFQMFGNDPGLTADRQRLFVHSVISVHPFGINNDPAEYRQSPALGSAAAAPGNDRDLILVGDLHDFGNFFRTGRVTDKIPFGGFHPPVMPHFRDPVIIHRVAETVRIGHPHILFAQNVDQFRADHFVHITVVSGKHFFLHIVLLL